MELSYEDENFEALDIVDVYLLLAGLLIPHDRGQLLFGGGLERGRSGSFCGGLTH